MNGNLTTQYTYDGYGPSRYLEDEDFFVEISVFGEDFTLESISHDNPAINALVNPRISLPMKDAPKEIVAYANLGREIREDIEKKILSDDTIQSATIAAAIQYANEIRAEAAYERRILTFEDGL